MKFGKVKILKLKLFIFQDIHLDIFVFIFLKKTILFTGDTLFSLGCGRIFEGTYEQMFTLYHKLKSLPKETKIYCGHEYTLKNSKFCLNMI